MKLRNDLITIENNEKVSEVVTTLNNKNCAGISERLERAVNRESEIYKKAIKNCGDDFQRRNALVNDYNETSVRFLIMNALEEAS